MIRRETVGQFFFLIFSRKDLDREFTATGGTPHAVRTRCDREFLAIGDIVARCKNEHHSRRRSLVMATSQDLENDWNMLCHDPDSWTWNGEA